MDRSPRRFGGSARILLASLLFLALAPAAHAAYTGGTVTSGGTLRGTVRFTGSIPAVEMIPVAQDVSACGDTVASDVLVIGSSKGVANAIVTIEGIAYGKRLTAHPDSLPRVTATRCRYSPRAQVALVGDRLNVTNADDLLHNAHARSETGETLWNFALPGRSYRIRKELKKPELITLRCEAGHPWMTAFVLVVDHPYGAVTDANGAFSMDQIPPGSYTVRVWHEVLGTQTRQVTLRPEETTTEELDFATIPEGALAPIAPPVVPEPPAATPDED